MTKTKFSPSVNIIRDANKHLNYLPTPNAGKISAEIANAFKKGTHAFTLIGSYGTGKSSFIWAFEQTLKGKHNFFDFNFGVKGNKFEFLNLVGTYQSIIDHFAERFNITNDYPGNQKIFEAIDRNYERNDLLVICIDEFGKFLEYASKNDPEKELYFIQQLAELVNDPDRNILLLTTLHQSFEAYSDDLANEAQKQEWRKVKGRYKELTFNEPIEQLLFLASQKFSGTFDPLPKKEAVGYSALIEKHGVFSIDKQSLAGFQQNLSPLEPVAAVVLTKALQYYGQNERSLFSFFEEVLENGKSQPTINLVYVYDYLIKHFYSFINTAFNPHYRHWSVLQNAIERVEIEIEDGQETALALVKTIGLLQVFASNGAKINQSFLQSYLNQFNHDKQAIEEGLNILSKKKILLYTKFNKSFKVFEGTDLDFDEAILKAGESIDDQVDIVALLSEHFDFPILTAKEATYKTGTPRLLEFCISEEPQLSLKPEGAKDGYVNLIFNEKLDAEDLKEATENQDQAILFGLFHKTETIRNCLLDIQKAKKVMADNNEDPVARRELNTIIKSHEKLLRHHVMDALYRDDVSWVFKGKEYAEIKSHKALNSHLSQICQQIYHQTPVFNNELANKHRISSAIHNSRREFFRNLNENWDQEDLGFPKDKFPAEKTIYLTLLWDNGMHVPNGDLYELKAPDKENSSFYSLWEECEGFFEEAKDERKNIKELYERLSQPPYKIKTGLADFWVPIYLFIKRGDYALFEEGVFVPELSDAYLHTIIRNPQDYEIKAFQIDGIRVQVFNKYRELVEQTPSNDLSTHSFLQTIKPFLSFYQGLDDYAKNTQRLTPESKALRKAIAEATDPEDAFFRDFPKAIGLDLETLANSEKDLNHFANTLNEAIKEIKGAYEALLNRIEKFIQEEVVGESKEFPAYRKKLQKRVAQLKEHQLLNHQKVLLERINSPINDRDSWLASIGQAVIKKPLNKINDQEEDLFKDCFQDLVREMDNLREVQKSTKENDEEVIKVDYTTQKDGTKSQNVHIPKGKNKEIEQQADKIRKELKGMGNLKEAVLAKIIKEAFDNDKQ